MPLKRIIFFLILLGFFFASGLYKDGRAQASNEKNTRFTHKELEYLEILVTRDEKGIAEHLTKAKEGDAESQYQLGLIYYYGDDVPRNSNQGIEWLSTAALQGHLEAQRKLGRIYRWGTDDLSQNCEESIKWLTMAAEQGNVFDQYLLGEAYYSCGGVPQDYTKAVKWYTKAAEWPDAQYRLGEMYYYGKGISKNYKEAFKWFSKAAKHKNGNDEVQIFLGSMYYHGEGVRQDYEEAFKWFLKAAKRGDAVAQFSLGLMYASGLGVPQDFVMAYMWNNLAASQGHADAAKNRDLIKMEMSPIQIVEAQRHSREFHLSRNKAISPEVWKTRKNTVNGTGFFITTDGYVLTAYHIVKDAFSVQAWRDDNFFPAQTVRVDPANDIALLKVDGVKVPALPLKSSRDVRSGEYTFTLGFPNIQLQGTEVKYTQGNISSLTGAADDPRLFQISVPVQPGNSGGPLLDDNGQVIGLVIAKLNERYTAKTTGSLPQNVNYALKSSLILSFLESLPELQGRLVSQKTKGHTSKTRLIEQTGAAVVMVLCD